MKGIPVVISAKGMAVKAVTSNAPLMTVAANGKGIPVQLSSKGIPFIVQGGGVPAPAISYSSGTYSVGDPDPGATYQWYYRGEVGGDQLIVGEAGVNYVASDIDAGRLIAVKDVTSGLFSNVIAHYLSEPVTLEEDFTAADGTALSTLGFTMAGGNPADYSKFRVLANRFKLNGSVSAFGTPATEPFAIIDTGDIVHYVEWTTTALVATAGSKLVAKYIDPQNYLEIRYSTDAGGWITVKPRVANTLGTGIGTYFGWLITTALAPIGTRFRVEVYSNNTAKLFINGVAHQQNYQSAATPGDVAYSFSSALAAGTKTGIGGEQYSNPELDNFKTGTLNKQIWLQAVSIVETAEPPIERHFRGTGSLQSGAATQLQTALVRDDGFLLQGWADADGISGLTFDVESLAISAAAQGHSVTVLIRDKTNMQYATSYPFPVPAYAPVEATRLGINESYYNDWSQHYAVRNRALSTWPEKNNSTAQNPFPPDLINADGFITGLPSGVTGATYRLFTTGVGRPGSEWICSWPAGWDASLLFAGSNGAINVIKDAVARTLRFTLPAENASRTICLWVQASGGVQTYPLNVTCYPVGDTETHLLASDDAVEAITTQGYKFIRYMTPTATNGGTVLDFGSHQTLSAAHPQVIGGAPGANIQFMVELCNRANCDLYWTPHIDSGADYIQYVTDYCAAHLNGKLMIELSNEIFNNIFFQYRRSAEHGAARGYLGVNGDLGPQPLRYESISAGSDGGSQYYWQALPFTTGDIALVYGEIWEALQDLPKRSALSHPSGHILFNSNTPVIGDNSIQVRPGTTKGWLVAGDKLRIRQGNTTIIAQDMVVAVDVPDVSLGGTIQFTNSFTANIPAVDLYVETQDSPYRVQEGPYWTKAYSFDEAEQAARRFRGSFSKEIFQIAYASYGAAAPDKVVRIIPVFTTESVDDFHRQLIFRDVLNWDGVWQYVDAWTDNMYIGGGEAKYSAGEYNYSSNIVQMAGVWDTTVRSYYNTDYDRTAEGLLAYMKKATDDTIASKMTRLMEFENYFQSKGRAPYEVKFVVYEGNHHIVPFNWPSDGSTAFLTPFLNGDHMARFAQYYLDKYQANIGGDLCLFCRVSQYTMPQAGNSSWGIQFTEQIEDLRPYGKVFQAFSTGKRLPGRPTLTVAQGATSDELVFTIAPGSAGNGAISGARVLVQNGAQGGFYPVTATFALSGGNWVATVTGFAPATAYTFKAEVTNEVGWSERSAQQAITTAGAGDVTPPTITSADPSGSYVEGDPIGGTLTADETVTWAVTGTDAGAVTLDPDTGEWVLEETVYATQSSYSFSFVATDLAANDSDPQVISITITEASAPSVRAFLEGRSTSTGASTHTFAAMTLGTADADRYIVALLTVYTAGNPSLTSLTLGGVTATLVAERTEGAATTKRTRMMIAQVPSGATGDVVATFAGTVDQCGVMLYSLTGIASATPLDTDTIGGANASFPAFSFTGGAHVIAGGISTYDNGTRISSASADTTDAPAITVDQNFSNVTWTGLTEDYDAQMSTSVANQAGWVAAAWAKI